MRRGIFVLVLVLGKTRGLVRNQGIRTRPSVPGSAGILPVDPLG